MARIALQPVLKIGSIAAVLTALALYMWWAMRVPAPREQDRVVHREGIYSMIQPRDWDVVFNYSDNDARYLDSVEIRLPTTRARDRRFFIGRFRTPPNLQVKPREEKQIDTQFQGQPAYVATGRTRLEHYWRAVFERSGQWYELVFWMPLPEDVPRSGWWPYLQSFRAAEASTTQPNAPTPSPLLRERAGEKVPYRTPDTPSPPPSP